ncbi:FAD binding domain-containing protein [Dictyobacter arantiisoli]|uniref:Carbon monoxide dehydrogenase n=1 Tax=Dictyobacter arantiisoli TaxID=2014874 RepID=A0A5A5T981_9CHLR|nr:xanthine dehydrogenase family protein subunit M [Dictyobacter arantiisoli]GCF07962.1 carbon monoxide dehydrogenase [Dictyobacter arantiisoli]
MIPAPFDYAAPTSLEEAVGLLNEHKGARILAGGHTLLNEMKIHYIDTPSMLVDLRRIPVLRGIKHAEDGTLRIGAMTTFAEIASDQGILKRYMALAEAANSTPDTPVRNWSTIGGNLAASSVGADLHAAILTFEATLNVFGRQGLRTITAHDFISGGFVLAADEIITSLDFPATAQKSGSAYEKFKNRASGYAVCGVALYAVPASDGTLRECRVAVTGVTNHAIRLPHIETILQGKRPDEELVITPNMISEEQDFIVDLAASAEYRAYLTQVLIGRALKQAIAETTSL